MKNKTNCYDCKYRRKLVGDAHSECVFEWNVNVDSMIKNNVKIIANQWSFGFPLNYDPHWLTKCSKFTLKD